MTELLSKEIWGFIAILLTFAAFGPYIFQIWFGHIRPHYFSFLIWGFTTFVIFLGQLADGGGAGAWPIGVSGIITLFVAWLAYLKRATHTVTKTDIFFLVIALSALPLWSVTNDPMWAVLLLVGIDLFGTIPTMRKAHVFPHEEQALFFSVMIARNAVSILALEHYSVTTLAFPVTIGLANIVLVGLILIRRLQLRGTRA